MTSKVRVILVSRALFQRTARCHDRIVLLLAFTIVVLGALGAVGCGGGSGNAVTASSTSTPATQTPLDACELVTPAQLGSALGGNWKNDGPQYGDGCEFSQIGGPLFMTIYVQDGWDQKRFSNQYSGFGNHEIAGVGDLAYCCSSALKVLMGETELHIFVAASTGTGNIDEPKAIAVAQIITGSDSASTSVPAAVAVSPTPKPTQAPTKPPTAIPTPRYDLEILSFKCTWETFGGSSGFAYVEGEVKNISSTRLDDVEAVGTWYTTDHTLITSDEALLDFNPILPGQTSPFKTYSTYNPAMDNCTLRFKHIFGEQIPALDSSQ